MTRKAYSKVFQNTSSRKKDEPVYDDLCLKSSICKEPDN